MAFRRLLPLFLILCFSPMLSAQTPATPGPAPVTAEDAHILKTVETFLRNLYAWGPAFDLKVGPLKDSAAPGLYEIPIQITYQGQSDSGVVYATKDGQFLLRGELFNTHRDPFAETRAKLTTANSPAKGPADAKITLIEFSDFQCPHCRQLAESLKDMESRHPDVRIVFKNFPLEQIHPWAMTAALAARCAFQHSPDAFWKVHDAIFAQQDLLDADNAWDKLSGLATSAGLQPDGFRTCIADPATKQAVESDRQLGLSLKITSTPTVYINGRESIGGDPAALEQLLSFERESLLQSHPSHSADHR